MCCDAPPPPPLTPLTVVEVICATPLITDFLSSLFHTSSFSTLDIIMAPRGVVATASSTTNCCCCLAKTTEIKSKVLMQIHVKTFQSKYKAISPHTLSINLTGSLQVVKIHLINSSL